VDEAGPFFFGSLSVHQFFPPGAEVLPTLIFLVKDLV